MPERLGTTVLESPLPYWPVSVFIPKHSLPSLWLKVVVVTALLRKWWGTAHLSLPQSTEVVWSARTRQHTGQTTLLFGQRGNCCYSPSPVSTNQHCMDDIKKHLSCTPYPQLKGGDTPRQSCHFPLQAHEGSSFWGVPPPLWHLEELITAGGHCKEPDLPDFRVIWTKATWEQ